MADIYGMLGAFGTTIMNNLWQQSLTGADREANFGYNEEAAMNADRRTRALYTDFYSPEALLRQYKAAGLSPSLMFGGTPGQGGMSGAQGAGANGLQTTYSPMSALEAAQVANIIAQTNKTKAETQNINKDTDLKVLQEEWQTMVNAEKFPEWQLFSSYSENGTSLYDEASKYKNFDQFKQWWADKSGGQPNEYERRALQKIYTASYYLDREIATLTNEEVSAQFYTNVTKELQKLDFDKLNAESTVQYLKQNVETNKLQEAQKKAWNDLLDRVGKRSETGKDVLLILGMLIDKALTQYKLPTIETGGKTININKGE